MMMKKMKEEERGVAREALERSTEGDVPRIDLLLEGVPCMLAEARRRRGRRDALAASVPLARLVIPRLAVAAALLVAISAALLLTADDTSTAARSTWDDVLVAGNGVSDELILGSILEAEADP